MTLRALISNERSLALPASLVNLDLCFKTFQKGHMAQIAFRAFSLGVVERGVTSQRSNESFIK